MSDLCELVIKNAGVFKFPRSYGLYMGRNDRYPVYLPHKYVKSVEKKDGYHTIVFERRFADQQYIRGLDPAYMTIFEHLKTGFRVESIKHI